MKKMLLLPAFVLLLCGCGPDYNFSPFVGAQQNWVTSPGGFSRMVDHVPIFPSGQYPSLPYIIMGSVSAGSEGDLAQAAKDQHADAVLISSERTYRTGSVAFAGPGVIFAQPIHHTDIMGNLIRYKH
jgi:hypothetical protein